MKDDIYLSLFQIFIASIMKLRSAVRMDRMDGKYIIQFFLPSGNLKHSQLILYMFKLHLSFVTIRKSEILDEHSFGWIELELS